ncbi:MAG: methyltransferase domain-containing protein [Lachnospiraceae bacterium]|nr:methyltransferase domain-containing protein [Lachnospiraceae bacterium]
MVKKVEKLDKLDKIEEIGKIKLNLNHYPGEDFYCDGDIEDELLTIARDYSKVEYPRIIEEKKSWPILYHLSSLRENIVEWLPIDKTMKVLEVGSGCGAITGALAKKAKEVTCIDLSKKRSMINAYRHMECDNVTIHVGNFQDIEPDLPCDYDYICLIGVFEYAQAYIGSETPYEDFLRIIEKHRKKDGSIAIAIENKFGLKYWAGCKEDHLGTWFSGLEDYPEGGVVRTFTRDGLLKIVKKCGYTDAHMYYPYPDYKFMTSLYSDDYLPKRGELSLNQRNFDRERLQLFDEKLVFDTIIKEEQFPMFSNSYMMILGPEPKVKYAKYSNDRADAYQIKTVYRNGEIEKHPLSKEAEKHIEKIYDAYRKLTERFDGSELLINQCELHQEGTEVYASFEYLEGRTLEELLDECLEKEKIDEFHMLFNEYLKRISYHEEMPVCDYDLIFANILITPDGKWHVIDYEWTFEKEVDTKEIAFRAIYCYVLENEKRNKLNLDLILQKLEITESDASRYRQQEMKFQKYVTGKRMSMGEIGEAIGQPVYTLNDLSAVSRDEKLKNKVQIYEDMGTGFSEENSYFLDEKEFELTIAAGRKMLRIDPCSDYCVVWIKELKWNGTVIPVKSRFVSCNGFRVGENTYAFATQDPNITLSTAELEQKQENLLAVSMQITAVPLETINHMQKRGLF